MPAEPGTLPEQEPELRRNRRPCRKTLMPTRRNRLHGADWSSFSHAADYGTEAGYGSPRGKAFEMAERESRTPATVIPQ
jgi:hypothetical protein